METSLLATAILTVLVFVLKNSKSISYAPVRVKAQSKQKRR